MKTIYDSIKDIHSWRDYTPTESKYGYYNGNIILTAQKISDLYIALCIARAQLHFLDNQNYGDFANDRDTEKFIDMMSVQNALFYYNTAIDFSWQVMWLYYEPEAEDTLLTNEMYERIVKKCDYESLRLRLTLAKDLKLRDGYLVKFFNEPIVKEVRKIYNYIKHRGALHFPILGANNPESQGIINGNIIPIIRRKPTEEESLKEKLITLDNILIPYVEDLIDIFIPKDYVERKDGLSSMFNYYMRHSDQIKEWNQINNNAN